MSNIFNFNRFRKYFIYDFSNAKNKFGLTMLICGIAPIIALILGVFINMISVYDRPDTVSETRFFVLAVSYLAVVMSMPVKAYGSITDKRVGSNWLLVPASCFEKFLSVILMVFLVVPICFCTLTVASDTLLGLFFPDLYGAPLINGGVEQLKEFGPYINSNSSKIEIAGEMYLGWCWSILIFTTGAVFFKKSKTAKTILVCLIYAALVLTFNSNPSGEFVCRIPFYGTGNFHVWIFARIMKIIFSVVKIIIFGGLLGGLYFRLRALKH